MADVDDLLMRLAKGLTQAGEAQPLPTRLCAAGARILECEGGAITMAYTRVERVTLAATDDIARLLEEHQDVVGQGPGPDAFSTGAYSRWDVVDGSGADPRWPLLESTSLTAFAPLVVHALPMGQGDQVIGVLTLYQRGVDRDIDLDSALVVAQVVAAALVADGPTLQDLGQGPWAERAEVHQATGMVVAQLGLPDNDALALIRADAYARDQSVGRSARDVVTGRLTFSESPGHEIEST